MWGWARPEAFDPSGSGLGFVWEVGSLSGDTGILSSLRFEFSIAVAAAGTWVCKRGVIPFRAFRAFRAF